MMGWGSEGLRWAAAVGVVLVYGAMCLGIWWSRRQARARAQRAAAAFAPAGGGQPWVVAHASQTGQAEQLAWQTAQALHTAGVPARLLSLSALTPDDLQQTERALFIVSTYGEGDPPDSAALFARRLMGRPLALSGLHYGVMALGDREYSQFCGFGKALDAWLASSGAASLFERVDVDNGAQTDILRWRDQLSHLVGTRDAPDWAGPAFEPWRLVARRRLNEGSAGGPTFHLELAPPAGASVAHWEAGDLLQVRPPVGADGATARPREYSIASVPADGRVHLLVRQELRTDGALGRASGWLTLLADEGAEIEARLRAHRNFRLGTNADRPLILIGNGTGLAGLRGHLKARAQQPGSRNWLLFGERNRAHDAYYLDELEAWRADGVLERLDLVFSRDTPERRYVQHQLRDCADTLRAWVDAGAAIYVCGSLEGMASGVEAVLVEVLGQEQVDRLSDAGRYRRDVY